MRIIVAGITTLKQYLNVISEDTESLGQNAAFTVVWHNYSIMVIMIESQIGGV